MRVAACALAETACQHAISTACCRLEHAVEVFETVNPALDEDRFRSGFTACANEVSRFLSSVPGVNLQFGTDLMSHLGSGLTKATSTSPLSVNTVSTSASQAPLPLSPISDGGYNSGRDSTPSPALSVGSEDIPQHIIKQEVVAPVASSNSSVWRPF